MNDLTEAHLELENPIEDSFDVHLSNFTERCVFLASNDTASPVEMIHTLTKSIKFYLFVMHVPKDSINSIPYQFNARLQTLSLMLAREFVIWPLKNDDVKVAQFVVQVA